MPWKVFWIVVGGILTLTAGVLPPLLDVDPLIVVPATVVLVIAAAVATRTAVEYSDIFCDTAISARSDITGLISIAIVAQGAWIVVFQFMPGWWMWWPLVLVALAGVEYFAAWSYEHVIAAKKRRGDSGHRGALVRPPLDDVGKIFAEALHRAGLGSVTIVGWKDLRDGDNT